MSIEIRTTPNPDSMSFIFDSKILSEGRSYDFDCRSKNIDICPVAKRMLTISGVTGVFIKENIFTIRKDNKNSWDMLQHEILDELSNYILFTDRIIIDNSDDTTNERNLSGIELRIAEIIQRQISPVISRDGGSIKFIRYHEKIVYVRLKGACVGCPSAILTLKGSVEKTLKYYIEEIKEVISVN